MGDDCGPFPASTLRRVSSHVQIFQDESDLGTRVSEHGTLVYTNEEELTIQRRAVREAFGTVVRSVWEGTDIQQVVLPLTLFEPRSLLERLTDMWSYAPNLLVKGSQATDPVERMKSVVAFAIGGLHLTCRPRKPFPPLLGETYQASYADGTRIYCEQTGVTRSHWEVFGPGDIFHFWGEGWWGASFRFNSVRGRQLGRSTVDFPDGQRISFTVPYAVLHGILWGERSFEWEGTMQFEDHVNHLACKVAFNPDARWWKYLLSLGRLTARPRCDRIVGDVYRLDPVTGVQTEVLSRVEGSWITHVEFDGERFWDRETFLPSKPIAEPDPLPSDCRFREDIQFMKERDLKRAEEYKDILEERQRYEESLRQNRLPTSHLLPFIDSSRPSFESSRPVSVQSITEGSEEGP